jgi:uncharacterized protein (UPF0548 family)
VTREAGATPSPRIERKLAELHTKPVNYDPATVDLEHPGPEWHVDDRCQPLPTEPPGKPVAEGSWQIAARLIRGYEFADPSIVRAFYTPQAPMAGRDMLLELRTLGVIRVYVGVRVGEVYDEDRTVDRRPVRVFGWYYRTLEGHVEMGQMNWEVWKWMDTGQVEFHVHAVSRTASIANPIVRLGFWALHGRERAGFLESTNRRMKAFTELALSGDGREKRIREASGGLTKRRLAQDDPAHAELARNVETRGPSS